VLKALKKDEIHWYLFAGSSLAIAFLIRFYTAPVFGIPGMLFLLYLLVVGRKPAAWGRAAVLTAPIVLAVLFLLWYNVQTTGEPFKLGYVQRYGSLNYPGLGERIIHRESSGTGEFLPQTQQHTALHGFILMQSNWAKINYSLFGWPVPSLIFLLPWFAGRNQSREENVVLASIGGLVIGYLFWFGRQPRMLTESLPWIVLMSARGIEYAHERCRSGIAGGAGIPSIVALCILYAVLFFYPLDLIPSMPSRAWINADLPKLVEEKGISNAVVFIDFESGEEHAVPGFVAHQSYLWNELNPEEGDIIYLRDLGDRNMELRTLEKGKTLWRYSYSPRLKRGELVPLDS
jgi:4-amino-4-deoxy-L-arabinose transferase-like glycosyltransferase